MESLINIEIIEKDKGGHEDLVFEIPGLISQQKFDTHYFALAIEPKKGIQEIKNAVAGLVASWNDKQAEFKKCLTDIISKIKTLANTVYSQSLALI